MSLFPKVADASDNDVLSIVLIGPDEQRRQTVAGVLAECMAASAGGPQRQALAAGMAIREFSSYSAGLDDLLQMLEQHCDVVMVDLDSDPTKLIEVVEIGKQLLVTRGSLTTFSIANDVAKYFAIIPALFAGTLPWLKVMDVMQLHSPTSAILSAVIFNALIIPALIPVALKGVRYRPLGADALLRRNLLIWGLGGVLLPFIGIKLIDLTMVSLHLVS